jgi:hypothetical protein
MQDIPRPTPVTSTTVEELMVYGVRFWSVFAGANQCIDFGGVKSMSDGSLEETLHIAPYRRACARLLALKSDPSIFQQCFSFAAVPRRVCRCDRVLQ